jgi:hypothetical protein
VLDNEVIFDPVHQAPARHEVFAGAGVVHELGIGLLIDQLREQLVLLVAVDVEAVLSGLQHEVAIRHWFSIP